MLRLSILTSVLSMWTVCAVSQDLTVCESPDSKRQVSINVIGEATGSPDMARLTLAADATAGNAEDALSQCQSKAQAAVEAITALNVPGATLNRRMYEFSSPSTGEGFSMMMQPSATPTGTRAVQQITVEIPLEDPVDKDALAQNIARVFQAANKAGVGFVASSLKESFLEKKANSVTYVLRDASDLRRKALEEALRKAEELREKLAGMNITIGAMAGLRCSEDDRRFASVCMPGFDEEDPVGGPTEATSTTPDKVVVRRSVSVSYDLTNK